MSTGIHRTHCRNRHERTRSSTYLCRAKPDTNRFMVRMRTGNVFDQKGKNARHTLRVWADRGGRGVQSR